MQIKDKRLFFRKLGLRAIFNLLLEFCKKFLDESPFVSM